MPIDCFGIAASVCREAMEDNTCPPMFFLRSSLRAMTTAEIFHVLFIETSIDGYRYLLIASH